MKISKRPFPNSASFILFLPVLFVCSLAVLFSCTNKDATISGSDIYSGFQNPPAEARPFVRWWWNGNKVRAEELERELELLKAAGFGGVEINPIGMPVGPDNGDKSLVWMSEEWIDMVVHACQKAKDLGMITDMIAGTGWPFGGEFLQQEETCQRIVTDYIVYKGGETIEADEQSLSEMFKRKYKISRSQRHLSKRTTYSLAYLSLVPDHCDASEKVIDLTNYLDENGKLVYTIDAPGSFLLYYGLIQQDFRDVTLGAPGGAGPVMDHYKNEMTYAYLARLKEISERSGIPLSELIRALFCDSIEVSGANWTDGFAELFHITYGYKLDQWLPFVFYTPRGDYTFSDSDTNFPAQFKDQVKRVRYDYNKLLVQTFLKNFTKVYKDFCTENNILCRYQAYGTPFLMGMLDGYMIPDIPESNNWIYSSEMKDSLWQWNQAHGYMIWNMYASSGAHLSGKRITSCETMTNLRGVFKTTLEEIKQHDDMNFITGINHSVLHGFNYSPPEIPFPGWIRFGAYFSEHNTWWKHLNHWADYNARLSFVFQNSQADKSIAIIGPTADLWGDNGLVREPFHLEPEYLYKLWEPISQSGYSCEYINQEVLKGAEIKNSSIVYGKMQYDVLILAGVESLDPPTARKIKTYVESGGKVVVLDHLPEKSLHFNDYIKNDQLVKNIMVDLLRSFPESMIMLSSPESMNELLAWTQQMLNRSGIPPDVVIGNPNENVYQIHQYTEDKEIYFFTNVNRYKTTKIAARFPVHGKYPWAWNPETGKKEPYHYDADPADLNIKLNPLESLLLVFEDEKPDKKTAPNDTQIRISKLVDGIWNVVGNRIDGQSFEWEMDDLIDFSQSGDSTQNSFGGEIIYSTTLNNTDNFTHVDLGDVNEGITELYVNGNRIGKHWYGKAVYPIADNIKEGDNEIEIRYTTVLANYCMSIDNNLMTREWTKRYNNKVPTGLEGPVMLLAY